MISNTLDFSSSRALDYWELAKPRLVSLSLLSAAVGFFLATSGPFDFGLFSVTLFGTALIAASSMAFNQLLERHEDAKMRRTASRPLPSGRLQPFEVFIFGTILAALGLVILFFAVNRVSAFLAVLTLVTYVLIYTPLKKMTPICTIVGAIPGALPPLIGWSAAGGRPTLEAWALFAIIFLWQMPHFLAIAWMWRDDYKAAKFRMLSVEDPDGREVARQILLYSLALLPVSLVPTFAGLTGPFYFVGSLALGLGLVGMAFFGLNRIEQMARPFFRATIIYLSLLLLLMIFNKV